MSEQKKKLKKNLGQVKEDFSQPRKQKDERFSFSQYDPRFTKVPLQVKKSKVDERFKRMFTDKEFAHMTKVDAYGREQSISEKQEKNKELLDLYYDSENSEIKERDEKLDSKLLKKNISNEKSQIKKIKQVEQNKQGYLKQQIGDDQEEQEEQVQEDQDSQDSQLSQGEDYSEGQEDPFKGGFKWDEVSSSDEQLEYRVESDDEIWDGLDKNVPKGTGGSSSLALMNYDWMNISAQNLMLLFNSLKPAQGQVKRVTVYLSPEGSKKLKEEEEQGPQGIWKQEDQEGEGGGAQVSGRLKRPIRNLRNEIIINAEDDNQDIDAQKLRRYEVSRLSYYFAIIECDSRKTAEHIYDQGNGVEFELSTIPLDLRMVPEESDLSKAQVKEECDRVPEMAEVNNVVNRSIGHTNVKLTWDEPVNRLGFLDGVKPEDMDKVDWKKYFNDGESEEDEEQEEEEEEDEKLKEEKRIKGEQSDWRKNFDKKKKKEIEMEITFEGGFNEVGNQILQKIKNKDESSWDKFQRVKKEKRKDFRQKKTKDEDYFIMDTKQNENKNKTTKISKEEEKLQLKNQEYLQLIGDDENQKAEFEPNFQDNRFKALHEKPEYALDPTDKLYRKETHQKWIQEQQTRRKKIKNNLEQ